MTIGLFSLTLEMNFCLGTQCELCKLRPPAPAASTSVLIFGTTVVPPAALLKMATFLVKVSVAADSLAGGFNGGESGKARAATSSIAWRPPLRDTEGRGSEI